MNIKRKIILIVCLLGSLIFLPTVLSAWNGYDYETDNYIEFAEDISTIQGKDIEIYDYSDDLYHEVRVISVDRYGEVIEVYDYDTGNMRTFEIEDGPNTTEFIT